MTIPTDGVTPVTGGVQSANAVLVGGPLAGRLVYVDSPTRPYLFTDDDGDLQEYRPDGTTAYVGGEDRGLPILRHSATV